MQQHRSYWVGTSGFNYRHWRERFYPKGLATARWLVYYAAQLPTVELNVTFYRLPTERAFAHWHDETPPDFRFAVKASRLITHLKRLKGVDEALDSFLARARLLGDKLGPILYQLPPGLQRNDELLEGFLRLLPPDLEHAFEFRHRSWFEPAVFDLLRRYGVAFCVMDWVGLPCPVVATARFAYVRFHGTAGRYWGAYSDDMLRRWAEQIAALGVATVYAYFNNDFNADAVFNAKTLMRLLTGDDSAGGDSGRA